MTYSFFMTWGEVVYKMWSYIEDNGQDSIELKQA